MTDNQTPSPFVDAEHLVDILGKASDVDAGIRNRREAFAEMDAALKTKGSLGAMDVEMPEEGRLSVLGAAVLYGDAPMANRLVEAGAKLRDDEHPASLVVEALHSEALEYGLEDDHGGTSGCLKALAKSGQDLNAPIEGVTPAAFITRELIDAKLEYGSAVDGPNPYKSLGGVLQDCADGGVDFNARCPDGLSLEDQVKGHLREMGVDNRMIEDEMPAVRRVQRDSRVKDAATQKSQRGGRNRSSGRDQDER